MSWKTLQSRIGIVLCKYYKWFLSLDTHNGFLGFCLILSRLRWLFFKLAWFLTVVFVWLGSLCSVMKGWGLLWLHSQWSHIVVYSVPHYAVSSNQEAHFLNLITVTIIFLSVTTNSLITWPALSWADSEGDSPLEWTRARLFLFGFCHFSSNPLELVQPNPPLNPNLTLLTSLPPLLAAASLQLW